MTSRAASWALAVASLAYLGAMYYTGAYPERGQFVKFEAKGLLREEPARVAQVSLTRAGITRVFVRGGSGWSERGRPVSESVARSLDTAVKFMHTSEPVRALPLDELKTQDPREFGLAPPRFTVSLTVGGAAVLDAGFGRTSPMGNVDYVGVIGRDHLYLLSHFVVEEWDKVAALSSP